MNRKDRRAQASQERKADYESETFRALRNAARSMKLGKENSEDVVPSSPCGHCGKVIEGASSGCGEKAKPGHILVCVYCGGVSVFGEDMALVKMSNDELDAHPQSEEIKEHQSLLRATMAKAYMGQKKGTMGDA